MDLLSGPSHKTGESRGMRRRAAPRRRVRALVLLVSVLVTLASPDRCWPVPVRDPEHRFGKGVRSWTALRDRNIVKQKQDYSCGAATLATVARYYWGDDVSEETFLRGLGKLLTAEEMKDRVANGLAISDLRRVAVKKGYLATIGTLSWSKLVEVRIPLILPIRTRGHNHFVVYRGSDLDRVYLADPIRGNVRVPISQFLCEWQKHAVLVFAKRGEKPRRYAPLLVSEDDLFFGELNWQLIRTQHRNLRPLPGPLP